MAYFDFNFQCKVNLAELWPKRKKVVRKEEKFWVENHFSSVKHNFEEKVRNYVKNGKKNENFNSLTKGNKEAKLHWKERYWILKSALLFWYRNKIKIHQKTFARKKKIHI